MLVHNKCALVQVGSGYPIKGIPYGNVYSIASESCYETHDTVYSEAKLYSMGVYIMISCHHMTAVAAIYGLRLIS